MTRPGTSPYRRWYQPVLVLALASAVGYWFAKGTGSEPSGGSAPPASRVPASVPGTLANPPALPADGKPRQGATPAALHDGLCQELANGASSASSASSASGASGASAQARFAIAPAQRDTVSGLLASLAQESDPTRRAAGLVLQAEWAAQQAALQLRAQYPDCGNDPACHEQVQARTQAAFARHANQLAQQAVNGRDPALYASAFYTCNPRDNRDGRSKAIQSGAPFCQQISASQWAERDPQNGLAWLFAAQQAQHKPAELEQALFRWSQAPQWQPRLVGLPQLQANSQLAGQAAAVQLALARLNHQVLYQHAPPEFGAVIQYCRLDQPGTNNRRAVCEAIARQLLADQTMVVTAGLGAQIGQQLGWEPARVLAMVKAQRQARPGAETGALAVASASTATIAATIATKPATMAKAGSDPAHSECLANLKQARAELNSMQFGEMDTVRKKLDSGLETQIQLQDEFLRFVLIGTDKSGATRP